MNKITVLSTILASAVAAGPAFANDMDTDWFVGAGVGYQNDDVSGQFEDGDEDVTSQLRGGVILNQNHRLMATYAYMDELEQHTVLGSYDYLLPVYDKVNLFLGASLGASNSEIHNDDSTEFVWGGQVGAMYEFTDNWTAEVTYRYLEQDYDENSTEIDNSQQVFLAVDYRF